MNTEDAKENAIQQQIKARKELTRSAWDAKEWNVDSQTWLDNLAPQWALDRVSQTEINHLIMYIWRA